MLDNKWHYTKNDDYPQIFGRYENQNYPQIPCLVEDLWGYGVRYWNVTEDCWDDEECDDFYCKKDEVIRWRYLDSLIEEK